MWNKKIHRGGKIPKKGAKMSSKMGQGGAIPNREKKKGKGINCVSIGSKGGERRGGADL